MRIWLARLPARALNGRKQLVHHRKPVRDFATSTAKVDNIVSSKPESATASRHVRIPTPPPSTIKDPRSWVPLVEPFLPRELREPSRFSGRIPGDTEHELLDIGAMLLEARTRGDVDVLSHIGLKEERWEAMIWIYKVLCEISRPTQTGEKSESLSNLDWPRSVPLEELSAEAPAVEKLNVSASLSPLDNMLARDDGSSEFVIQCLGQVWQSLGTLIIAASERNESESRIVMSKALRVLAVLHRNGWVPDSVYQFAPSNDPSALSQPPLLHSLSTEIFISLADAEYESSWNFQGPQLRPELWLEFVLWCCVHGGWFEEGAALVLLMSKKPLHEKWSFTSWRDILRNAKDEFARSPAGQREVQHTRSSRHSYKLQSVAEYSYVAKKTVSAEVVVALIDGLAIRSSPTGNLRSIGASLRQIVELKRALDCSYTSLGVSTWASIIRSLTDTVKVDELGKNRLALEYVLERVDTDADEIDLHENPLLESTDVSTPVPAYVNGRCLAVERLFHHLLQIHILAKDLSGAIRVLNRLGRLAKYNEYPRTLISSGETASFEDWLAQLSSLGVVGHSNNNVESKVSPLLSVQIPVGLLAELIDLLIEFDQLDTVRQMFYPQEAEAAIIPSKLYGHQILAPALIRYAAATSDPVLLSKLTAAQAASIATSTIMCLFVYHIDQAQLDNADGLLKFIKKRADTGSHLPDLTKAAGALIKQISARSPSQERVLQKAETLLQSLLRDELKSASANPRRELYTIVGILCTIDGWMMDACREFLTLQKNHKVELSTEGFNDILNAVVRVHGSNRGRILYELWCRVAGRRIRHIGYMKRRHDLASPFIDQSVQSMPSIPTNRTAWYSGKVEPSIGTLRIIVHQYLEEQKQKQAASPVTGAKTGETIDASSDESRDGLGSSPPQSPRQVDIVAWAAVVLREDFGLQDELINYELQGHLPTTNTNG